MTKNLSPPVVVLALLGALAWTGWLAGNHVAGAASILDRFETVLLDLRIALTGKRTPPEDVVIVAIDDRTVTHSGTYPLPRSELAGLIGAIEQAGAKALAIDILLTGPSDAEEAKFLASTIGSLPTVLASAGQAGDAPPSAKAVPAVTSILAPSPALAEAADVGLANIVTDRGGTPRHIPQLFLTTDGLQSSFGLSGVGLYRDETPVFAESGLRLGDEVRSLDFGWHLALNYYGPGGTISTVSARDLLDGLPEAAAQLEDRLVVLGVTATAVGDRFGTPFDPVMPGVEIQATGMANLIDGSALVRDADTRWVDAAAALVVTLAGLVVVLLLPLASASIVYLLLLAGWLAVTAVFFAEGHWLNGALPFAASLPPVIGLIIARQIADRVHARRSLKAQEALSRFQSPLLAKRITEDPSFLASPREQKAAILFIDLSGYTGLSERLGAAKTRDFLKAFHTIVVDVANGENGVVLDFMGDGAMLGFGVPDLGDEDPINAWRCAFLLEREVTGWLGTEGIDMSTGGVRVGAHFGDVVLSRLGHDDQQQITATGDTVNVASRLLDVAKTNTAGVVISADLIRAAENATRVKARVPWLETVAVRGRRQNLAVGLWKAGESASGLEAFR